MLDNKPIIDDTPHRNIESFKKDIVALFRKQKGGHTARWVYHNGYRGGHQPTGSKLWTKFLEASGEQYYPFIEEQQLIAWHAKTLSERFKDADTIVDLGAGGPNAVHHKAMPIVLGCESVKIYSPVDLSWGLLKDAKAQAVNDIAKAGREIEVSAKHGDFYRAITPSGKPLRLNGRNRAGLFLGSTITNMNMREGDEFPRERIKGQIQRLASLIGSSRGNCTLTFGYDSNPDLENAASAYDRDEWKQLNVGLMLDIYNVLKPEGNFNPLAWEHKTVIDEQSHVLHQCVVATENQTFSIDGEHFAIKKGERFVTKNNFKYPLDLFGDMVRETGHGTDEPIIHPSQRMVFQTVTINHDALAPG